MTTSSPFSIVVGLDFREAGGHAFGEAARLAQTIDRCHLHLVHVFEGQVDAERRKQLIGQLRLYANEKATSLGGLPGVSVGIHLRVGEPVREIVQLAVDIGANMIVVGAEKWPSFGTVAQRLALWAPCPVLVAGPKPPTVQHQPANEPPCADCQQARTRSMFATWWCERHAQHHAPAHVYSYQQELPFASHDSAVTPTGIDF